LFLALFSPAHFSGRKRNINGTKRHEPDDAGTRTGQRRRCTTPLHLFFVFDVIGIVFHTVNIAAATSYLSSALALLHHIINNRNKRKMASRLTCICIFYNIYNKTGRARAQHFGKVTCILSYFTSFQSVRMLRKRLPSSLQLLLPLIQCHHWTFG
jgi:hypothetical protein